MRVWTLLLDGSQTFGPLRPEMFFFFVSFFENCWLLRTLSLLRLEEEAAAAHSCDTQPSLIAACFCVSISETVVWPRQDVNYVTLITLYYCYYYSPKALCYVAGELSKTLNRQKAYVLFVPAGVS